MVEQLSEYDTLINPIEERMIRSVWRIVRDPDDFEDAFQEALATVWKRLAQIRRHPNPSALVLRICVNAAYDVLRKKTKLRRREELNAIPESYPDAAPSPHEQLRGKCEETEIFQAIGQLPRNQAEAVLLRFVQDLSYPEIAQALGCSENTARQHIARARARLCEMLAHLAPLSPKEVMK